MNIRERELVEVTFNGNDRLKELIREGNTPKSIIVNGEEFRLIEDEERANKDSYYVSRSAKIYSVSSNNYVKPQRDRGDYFHVQLLNSEKAGRFVKKFYVHHVVAYTFLGARPTYISSNGKVVDMVLHHKDGDNANNHLSNLAYVTHSENLSSENVRRLDNKKAEQVYRRYLEDKNFNVEKIAEEFDVGLQTIHNVIDKVSYKDITDVVDVEKKLNDVMGSIGNLKRSIKSTINVKSLKDVRA